MTVLLPSREMPSIPIRTNINRNDWYCAPLASDPRYKIEPSYIEDTFDHVLEYGESKVDTIGHRVMKHNIQSNETMVLLNSLTKQAVYIPQLASINDRIVNFDEGKRRDEINELKELFAKQAASVKIKGDIFRKKYSKLSKEEKLKTMGTINPIAILTKD